MPVVGRAATSPAVAWRGLLALGGGLAMFLMAWSGGYGYHRDELYFIAVGARPAWGYVDQPALVPLLAHALDAGSGRSLCALRLPSAAAVAAVVVVTGLIAREMGGKPAAQLVAAAAMAVSSVRRWRCFLVAYVALAVTFLVTGGKAYYLAGLYPVLLAAGATPTVAWARRRRSWPRPSAPPTASSPA